MPFERAFSSALAVVCASALVPDSPGAILAYSTNLKDGLTPTAMASDAQGNLYLAGSVVTDPVSGATTAVVAKLDPHAGGFLYLAYLDSTASDHVGAVTVDSAGNAYVTGSTVNPNFPATGGKLATLPTGPQDAGSFVTKLSPTDAANADGSTNSCANPAKLGSVVSFFVHGIGKPACLCFDAAIGPDSMTVVDVAGVNGYVTRVDAQVPNTLAAASFSIGSPVTASEFQASLRLGLSPVRPVMLPVSGLSPVGLSLVVWATK